MYKALTLPLLLTLFLHGLIVAAVLFDAPGSQPMVRRAATKYISAELVVLEKAKPKKAKPKKQVVKSKPKTVTEKTPPKKDDDRAKKIAQEKAEAIRQAQLKKDRQRKEQEQKAKRDQQRRIEQQNAQELADAIERESSVDQVSSAEELANSYIALITEVIQNNWSRPPSARNFMTVELALQLLPTGEVVSVKIVRGSGNSAFDRSAEKAVLRAGQFPQLQNLPAKVFEQYFRRLHLKFRPEDLRQ